MFMKLKMYLKLDQQMERRAPRPYSIENSIGSLPFTVKFARVKSPIEEIQNLRHETFGDHYPDLVSFMREEDKRDWQDGSIVLYAQSKHNDEILGSLRATDNLKRPIQYEREVQLPDYLQGKVMASTNRFVIARGTGAVLVKMALIKAMYLYVVAAQIPYVMLAAMPPANRLYHRLGFKSLFEDERLFQLSDFPKPITLSVIETELFASELKRRNFPFYEFIFRQTHPDIEVFSAIKNSQSQPRLAKTVLKVAEPL
jgi:hypothetical protein